MTELAQVRSMLEVALRRIDDLHKLLEPKQAPVTVAEFAKRVRVHPNTVHRWIAAGTVTKQDGRIPYSELRRFLT